MQKDNHIKKVRQGLIPYGDGETLCEVESDDINLKSFEVKNKLHPKFWINDKINSRVRLKLLDLADEFFASLAVDWVKPKDILLTGSIANYNWSKYSDVDLHILIDFKDVWKKTEFVRDYFDSKKQIWSQEHDTLKIYGFPVEIYVEDVNSPNNSTGVYSLNKNKWIVEPDDFQDANLHEKYIKQKSATIMTKIDDLEKKLKNSDDDHVIETCGKELKKILTKLRKLRKDSLKSGGEMSSGNIIYKVLRRTNYLKKLNDLINSSYDIVNSIKESKDRMIVITESQRQRLLNEDVYDIEDYMTEYDEYYVLSEFKDNPNGKQDWGPLIDPSMYEKALQEFTKYGHFVNFPTKYIYQWFGIIIKNSIILNSNTNLAGHSSYFDSEAIEDVFHDEIVEMFGEDYETHKESDFEFYSNFLDKIGFYDWMVAPDGSDAFSDYGLKPLWDIIVQYNENLTPEEVIVLLNKALDVYHCRGDLASLFIKGGSKSLLKISDGTYVTESKKKYLYNR